MCGAGIGELAGALGFPRPDLGVEVSLEVRFAISASKYVVGRSAWIKSDWMRLIVQIRAVM
jgi:hypothetical protein